MPPDWYRTPDWDDSARADFEARLARATVGNQPQYLRIKALALSAASELEAADGLLRRIVANYPEAFDVPIAVETLGDIARRRGDVAEAVTFYRWAVAMSPTGNGTTGMAQVSLAEVLTEQGDAAGALLLLEAALATHALGFDCNRFRWNVARARAASLAGDGTTAADEARRALEVLASPARFPHHRIAGLSEPDAATMTWLRTTASGEAS